MTGGMKGCYVYCTNTAKPIVIEAVELLECFQWSDIEFQIKSCSAKALEKTQVLSDGLMQKYFG